MWSWHSICETFQNVSIIELSISLKMMHYFFFLCLTNNTCFIWSIRNPILIRYSVFNTKYIHTTNRIEFSNENPFRYICYCASQLCTMHILKLFYLLSFICRRNERNPLINAIVCRMYTLNLEFKRLTWQTKCIQTISQKIECHTNRWRKWFQWIQDKK